MPRRRLFWAFGYNSAAILAGAAMGFSSVSVVANSLRLRRFGRADPASPTDLPL